MSLSAAVLTDFTQGEVSTKFGGRVDLPMYQKSCLTIENWVPFPQGGATTRPGSKYIGLTKSGLYGRIFPFVVSESVFFLLEFTDQVLRIWNPNASPEAVIADPDGGGDDSIPTTYSTAAHIKELKFAQDGNKLFIVHKSHAPMVLTWTSGTSFTYAAWGIEGNTGMLPFQSATNYPGCVAFFDQRLWAGPTTTDPQTLWGSRSYVYTAGDPWAATTGYDSGAVVSNDTGKLYRCVRSGISAASGGPTGTAVVAMMDHGDAEGAGTDPHLTGEASSTEVNCTFAQSAAQYHGGSKSFLFTKTVAAGTVGTNYFHDALSTTDLVGLIPGRSYTLTVWVYIPAAGIQGTEVVIGIGDHNGTDWQVSTALAQNTYAAWQKVEVTRTIRLEALGCEVFIRAASDAAIDETFYVDDAAFNLDGILDGSAYWEYWTTEGKLDFSYFDNVTYTTKQLKPVASWVDPDIPELQEVTSYRQVVAADHAMELPLASDRADPITQIVPGNMLVIGTISSEYVIESGMSALEPKVDRRSGHGSMAGVQGCLFNDYILYPQRFGTRLRKYQYSSEAEAYKSPDLTFKNDTVLGTAGAVAMDVSTVPDPRVYLVRADGQMAILLADGSAEVEAWYRYVSGFSDTYESVAVVRGSAGDAVYTIVNRGTGYRCIEKFDAIADATSYPLDSWVSVASAGATVTGLERFLSHTVSYFNVTDGTLVTGAVSAGGVLTVPTGDQGDNLIIGAPFTCQLKTMRVNTQGPYGTGFMRNKRVASVTVMVEASYPFKMGYVNTAALLETPTWTSPYTGNAPCPFNGTWDRDAWVMAVQDTPYHATILAMVPEVET